jgi:hypothetical protein
MGHPLLGRPLGEKLIEFALRGIPPLLRLRVCSSGDRHTACECPVPIVGAVLGTLNMPCRRESCRT